MSEMTRRALRYLLLGLALLAATQFCFWSYVIQGLLHVANRLGRHPEKRYMCRLQMGETPPAPPVDLGSMHPDDADWIRTAAANYRRLVG